MIIAKEKFETNIIEYLIYMFQVEDLLRACKLDEQTIKKVILSQYKTDEGIKQEIEDWYLALAQALIEEKKDKSGHLQYLISKINEINDFHLYILQDKEHGDYQGEFQNIVPIIQSLRAKNNIEQNDVELLTETIYGYFLLKIQKKEISEDTQNSIAQISKLLGLLAFKFKQYENGEIKIE